MISIGEYFIYDDNIYEAKNIAEDLRGTTMFMCCLVGDSKITVFQKRDLTKIEPLSPTMTSQTSESGREISLQFIPPNKFVLSNGVIDFPVEFKDLNVLNGLLRKFFKVKKDSIATYRDSVRSYEANKLDQDLTLDEDFTEDDEDLLNSILPDYNSKGLK